MTKEAWIWIKCYRCDGRRFEEETGPSRLCQKCGGDGSILVKIGQLIKEVCDADNGK